MSSPRTPRRKARRRAFQVLFGLAFEAPIGPNGLANAVEEAPVDPTAPPTDDPYVLTLTRGVWDRREELDRVIAQHSQHWKIGRIARVELTILRLGLYEILHQEDIPLRVALNEAVELAKEFGDDNSPAFVNGILDAVANAVDQGRYGVTKALDKTKQEDETP